MSKQRSPNYESSPGDRPRQQAAAPEKAEKPEKEKRTKTKPTSPWTWGLASRVLVSVLASLHILAIFSAPWALSLPSGYFFPPRDAQGRTIPEDRIRLEEIEFEPPVLVSWLAESFQHYNNLIYANSGYDYFSPDPVWSHIVRFEIFDEAGQKIKEGRFPDASQQWPRLFYHRHMMLVDQSAGPDLIGVEYTTARRLLDRYGGERVRLEQIRHHLLKRQQVLDGKKLDDPSTYEVLGWFEYRRGDPIPDAPGPPVEAIAIPGGGP